MFLPTSLEEAAAQGVSELDVIIVSADAYVDHPAFAAAIIGRYLQSLGLSVGIIPQPDWRGITDFTALGRPRLFFGVTAGNMDSMVSLYTAQRKIRSEDSYSEKGLSGKRPYLPTIIYTNRLKEAFKGTPVIIGGIEASLRRIAHYDYYSDKVRPSILLDSKADLLVYGNGELPLKEIVSRLRSGKKISEIKDVHGTAVPVGSKEKNALDFSRIVSLPSFEEVSVGKTAFNEMTQKLMANLNPYSAAPLFQETGTRGVLINPPSRPLSTEEMDNIYSLPFTRRPHPRYKSHIPAVRVVENSITAHRGCYGGCSFCSLYMHQGKFIQSRSEESIKKEASLLKNVTDIGGPTANMYGTFCKNKKAMECCKRRSCLFPSVCENLETSSKNYLKVLRSVSKMPGIRNVYINSGIRFDIALINPDFIDELVIHYTPGQLSVAPEHCDNRILKIMGKPPVEKFNEFAILFRDKSMAASRKQYLIPYFIVGHPGADEKSENLLKTFFKRNNIKVEQIQEFYPTPMSISTSIYYTGIDPATGENIYSERKPSVKKQWKSTLREGV